MVPPGYVATSDKAVVGPKEEANEPEPQIEEPNAKDAAVGSVVTVGMTIQKERFMTISTRGSSHLAN